MKKLFLLLAINGLLLQSARADRTAGSYDSGETAPFNLAGGSMGASTPPAQIKCLLAKIGIKEPTATQTAEGLSKALQAMKFQSDQFPPSALLHFIAQIKAESGAGAENTEKGAKSPDKTGYGLIQVTGQTNLNKAQQCINQKAPGRCTGGQTNPGQVFGAGAKDQFCPAMASLCWWEANITQNEGHNKYAKEMNGEADKHISSIVNTGHDGTGAGMTGGVKNANDRATTFEQLEQGEQSCRQYSI